MKLRTIALKEKEPVIAVTVLFLLGMLGGFLFLKLIGVVIGAEGFTVDHSYLLQVGEAEASFDLYLYLVGRQVRAVGLFLLVGMTWLNLPYLAWKLLKQGFLLSFLGVSLVMEYQWQGLLVLLAYYLPHALVKVPLWLYCFYLIWKLEERKKEEPNVRVVNFSLHNLNMLQLDGKRVMLILAGCFLQSLLETVPGTWLLKKAVSLL